MIFFTSELFFSLNLFCIETTTEATQSLHIAIHIYLPLNIAYINSKSLRI